MPNPPNEDDYTSEMGSSTADDMDRLNEPAAQRKLSRSALIKAGVLSLFVILVAGVAIAVARNNHREADARSASKRDAESPAKSLDLKSTASYPPISTDQEISQEELAYALRAYTYLGHISEPRRKGALIEDLLKVTNREFPKGHPVTEIFRSKDRLRDYLNEVYSAAKKTEAELSRLDPSDFDALQKIQIETICWGATLALISKNISIDGKNASYNLTISKLNAYLFTLGDMAGYGATARVMTEKNDATADGIMRLKMLIAQYKDAQERIPMCRLNFEDGMKEHFAQ